MHTTIKICLSDCRFYSYHGFYPEEQVLGNEFFIDISAEYAPSNPLDDDLDHTLNYEAVYQILKEEMSIPRKLIETVAQSILTRIKAISAGIRHLYVSIRKSNPPFGGDRAQAAVTLEWGKD